MIRRNRLWLVASILAATGSGLLGETTPIPASPPTTAPAAVTGAAEAKPSETGKDAPRSILQKLADVIQTVKIENAPARQAFNWWSNVSGIPLVINWETMAKDGIDPDKTIILELGNAGVGDVLALLMKQTQTEQQTLLFERTRWYVQVVTKAEANRHPVALVYDVSDLIQDVPDFLPAGNFDLNATLGNNNRNNANGSAPINNGLFGPAKPVDAPIKTSAQKGEELAKVVRDTIEPTLWKENGGTVCSIQYFQGKLIVSAPMYVHAQIGFPVMRPKADLVP
jgi:hypothetical protein